MKNIGISKAIPISTGSQLLSNALLGAFIFHEWKSKNQLLLGFTALFILIVGSTLTAIKDKSVTKTAFKENWKKGTLSLIFSTLGYLGYTAIITTTRVDTKSMILPQGIGMFFGALLFSVSKDLFSKESIKSTLKNIITGIVWGIGNFFMFLSTEKVGLAISFSLSQTGIIISTFGSIFFLGEQKTKKEMIFVSVGCILVIVGGFLLGTMKV